MKKKLFSKKLNLRKSTIVHLDRSESANVVGGATGTVEPFCSSVTNALSDCICDTIHYTKCVLTEECSTGIECY